MSNYNKNIYENESEKEEKPEFARSLSLSTLTLALWSHLESNQAPTDYESVALTEWAIGPMFFLSYLFYLCLRVACNG